MTTKSKKTEQVLTKKAMLENAAALMLCLQEMMEALQVNGAKADPELLNDALITIDDLLVNGSEEYLKARQDCEYNFTETLYYLQRLSGEYRSNRAKTKI